MVSSYDVNGMGDPIADCDQREIRHLCPSCGHMIYYSWVREDYSGPKPEKGILVSSEEVTLDFPTTGEKR